MKNMIVFALVSGFLALLVLPFTGCQQQQAAAPGDSPLLVDQNYKLRQEAKANDKQISSLENELQNCQSDKEALQKRFDQMAGMQGDQIMEMMTPVMQKSQELADENKMLKAKIKQLQSQNQQ